MPRLAKILRLCYPTRPAIAAVVLAIGLTLGSSRDAHALTIVLDFVTSRTTDIVGTIAIPADLADFGFYGLSTEQIGQAVLAAVINDFLGYPTAGSVPSSPLPSGKELNINFALGFDNTTAPSNGDPEYYYVAISDFTNFHTIPQACFGCVRNSGGSGPSFPAANHDTIGSAPVSGGWAYLAGSNEGHVNILAGFISDAIAHSLSLDFPLSPAANPGNSLYSLMYLDHGYWARDRAFSYTEFGELIGAVGVRDVGGAAFPEPSAVPEPSTWILFGTGFAVIARARLRKRAA